MQAAINLGITEIIVETDVALVKQAICAGDFTHSLMGSLLDEL
jgi:hypothetical protein